MTATNTGSPFLKLLGGFLIILAASVGGWKMFAAPYIYGAHGSSANVAAATAVAQEPCLGVLCNITLMPGEEKVVNPKGYYFYSKTDKGVIILSGPNGEKEAGRKGPGYLDGFVIVSVRARKGGAEMRYILCSKPKTDMAQLNCV